jgi:hypothetical protein
MCFPLTARLNPEPAPALAGLARGVVRAQDGHLPLPAVRSNVIPLLAAAMPCAPRFPTQTRASRDEIPNKSTVPTEDLMEEVLWLR